MASTCLVSRWEQVRFLSLAPCAQGVTAARRPSKSDDRVRVPVRAPRRGPSGEGTELQPRLRLDRHQSATPTLSQLDGSSSQLLPGRVQVRLLPRAPIGLAQRMGRCAPNAADAGSSPAEVAMFPKINGGSPRYERGGCGFESLRERQATTHVALGAARPYKPWSGVRSSGRALSGAAGTLAGAHNPDLPGSTPGAATTLR